MARKVVGGLIQLSNPLNDENASVLQIRDAMLEKHLPWIHEAGKKGVQLLCLQEVFNTPYFCPSQDPKWYDTAEAVPGPSTDKLTPRVRVTAKRLWLIYVGLTGLQVALLLPAMDLFDAVNHAFASSTERELRMSGMM